MNTGLHKYDTRSTRNLHGVHPHLVAIVEHAAEASAIQFVVTEGLRTPARQAALVQAGASQTHHSRHLTGHAVDLAAVVDGQVRWDWPLYRQLAAALLLAADHLRTPLIWGGNWRKFPDGPHFELPRLIYPPDKEPTP